MRDTYYGFGDVIIRAALDSLKTEKEYFFDTTENVWSLMVIRDILLRCVLTFKKFLSSWVRDSAGFLFWETSKGFNFRSLDRMFDTTGKVIKKF